VARKERALTSSAAKRALLEHMKHPDYVAVPQRTLLHQMQVPSDQRETVRRALRELKHAGRIVRLRRGRLALSGQPVEKRKPRPTPSGPPERGSRLLGVLEQRRTRLHLRCFDASVDATIVVDPGDGIVSGLAVAVELTRAATDAKPAGATVVEIFGDFDAPGTDQKIVVARYGLPDKLPSAVLKAAAALPSRVGPSESKHRERFEEPACVTIDGETARDFDDAIAVERIAAGGFRLYVHIADVSHFVRPGDVIDSEAQRRGTSVYFPSGMLPMLPEKLSTDLCSLRPGVDRLVQSAIIDFDKSGKPLRTRFADGVIRSAARLTYTQVAEVFDGATRVSGVPARLIPMLREADHLRRALERCRHHRGSVDFDLPEPQILLDVEGVMTGIRIEPRNKAHRLIEECMIAANEAVARALEEKGHACMYRVHDTPDAEKIEALADFAKSLGYRLSGDGRTIHPGDVGHLLEQAEGQPEQALLAQVALRSMQQARYSMDNSGHFGLASDSYCHFTSPIRRYPDLAVHRLLRSLRGHPTARGAEIDNESHETLAASCSRLERSAEAAERELLAWKKVRFIAGKEGECFEGRVSGVASFGLFIQLDENMVEGLVRVESLGQEYFIFDGKRIELRGTRTGLTYRIGTRVNVRVERVDTVLRRVDFSLESGDGQEPRTRRRPDSGVRKSRRSSRRR